MKSADCCMYLITEPCRTLNVMFDIDVRIVSRSRTMHSQSPPLTIGGTVLKESDDLVILGVTFD